MNIALIGSEGTGKTTIAGLLAKKLEKKLVSTDEELAKKARMNVESLIKKYGWKKFYDMESEIVENVSGLDECIFDTGRGIVLRNENIINLKKNALIVLLTADMREIMNRIKNNEKAGKKGNMDGANNIPEEIESRCRRAADYTIDTSGLSPEEASDLIAHYVRLELQ